MCHHSNNFHGKRSVTRNVAVPFLYKVPENEGEEGVQLDIHGSGTSQRREDIFKWIHCRRTQNLHVSGRIIEVDPAYKCRGRSVHRDGHPHVEDFVC
jgi:hypothetical protein